MGKYKGMFMGTFFHGEIHRCYMSKCKDWGWVHGTNWDSSGLDSDGFSVNGGRKAFIQSSLEFWYGKFTQEPLVNLFQTAQRPGFQK